MKKISLFLKLIALMSMLAINTIIAQYPTNLYCNSLGLMGEPIGGIYAYNDWFTNITFAGINNNSIKGGWLTEYSSTTHGSVQRGQTYTLSVTVNSAGADFNYQYIAAYIDWNRDGDCGLRSGGIVEDAGEGYLIGRGASHPATMTLNITIPSDAAIGTTWMRLMLDADSPEGAGDYTCAVGYGEIKDFAIDIAEALPVELTTFTASIIENNVTLNWRTATEVNNYGFDVERNNIRNIIDSQSSQWDKVGFVNGHGNSNSPKEYSFVDKPFGGCEFKYRLKQIDIDGKYEYSPEVEVKLEVPHEFSIKQNFPNPFNPTTIIEYTIPTDNNVQIIVFNVLGMQVATLLNEFKQAGVHHVEFNAGNLSSGIYFYKIVSGNNSELKRMILLR